ncbi:thioredoxin family protein [Oscillospiraceae bacterium OttesenSCG-928-F05]|nr:thioredoxin family protein [Oscillospiraceae bacterium OttesenSCG-928-F05]
MDKAKSKGMAVKIIVPVLIVCVIATIFIFKNSGGETENPALNIPLTLTEVNMEEVTAHGLPVIIDFGADSCIPCKEMAPVLVKLNEEMQGKAVIHFIDVWKNPEAAQDFPVQVIPTQVFVTADGKPYVPNEDLGITGFTMYSTRDTNEHVFTVHEGGLTEQQMRLILADMGVAE